VLKKSGSPKSPESPKDGRFGIQLSYNGPKYGKLWKEGAAGINDIGKAFHFCGAVLFRGTHVYR